MDELAAHSLADWGEEQTQRYIDDLANARRMLSERSHLGRPIASSLQNWRRLEQGSHIILYHVLKDAVRVQRIIHRHRAVERLIR